MTHKSLVEVEYRGLGAVGSAAWRHRNNIRATVVVKAEFSFADGALKQVTSEPVRPDTDMAFVLKRSEVVLAGVPGEKAAPNARMLVWRAQEKLLEVLFVTSQAPGAPLGGRLSPFAPERSQHLKGFSPTTFAQPFVDLPDSFDDTFFQSAPASQQLPSLAGGDTIVLENLHPGYRSLVLRLPTIDLTGSGGMEDRSVPIRFRFDTAVVDAERDCCTLLWRGRLATKSVENLRRLRAYVQLGVVEPGVVEGDKIAPVAQAAAISKPSPFEGTVALSGTAMAAAGAFPVTPFAAQTGSEPPPSSSAAAIPGAPWARSAQPAPFVQKPQGIKETMGVLDTFNDGDAEPPAPVPPPARFDRTSDIAAPASAPAPVPAPAPVVDPAEQLRVQEQARLETEAQAAEAERKAAEQAAAEERRRVEAERFQAEQAAARQAEQERQSKQTAARKKILKKVKTGMYGAFKKKS